MGFDGVNVGRMVFAGSAILMGLIAPNPTHGCTPPGTIGTEGAAGSAREVARRVLA